ncbi:MAG: ACT domain-containing protein [Lachnospiraceae bacterium]|nr:ACT domain-containing protein [Lachnospiraceae bacterium]
MSDGSNYYVVKEKAVPEVLMKVVEAKRLLETGRASTVQEAADAVGISRSSFYKYKEDIFPFRDNVQGRTFTFLMQVHDEPGLLSDVLRVVAEYRANILTIHQSIPTNGIAMLTLSIEVLPATGDLSSMIKAIEAEEGVKDLKILARE